MLQFDFSDMYMQANSHEWFCYQRRVPKTDNTFQMNILIEFIAQNNAIWKQEVKKDADWESVKRTKS